MSMLQSFIGGQKAQESDSRTSMIHEMERKLNSSWFNRRANKDSYATISIAQYWDFLTYIDVSRI